jgi:hypothetical protein
MSGVEPGDLSGAERLLWVAFPRGDWADLREGDAVADDLGKAPRWGPDRVIRAGVIRALLLGACAGEPGHAPAVRLRGARVSGRLDLMGATVNSVLLCEHCWFDAEVRLVEATTRTVRIVDSRLRRLNGTRMRADASSTWPGALSTACCCWIRPRSLGRRASAT